MYSHLQAACAFVGHSYVVVILLQFKYNRAALSARIPSTIHVTSAPGTNVDFVQFHPYSRLYLLYGFLNPIC